MTNGKFDPQDPNEQQEQATDDTQNAGGQGSEEKVPEGQGALVD